MSTPTCVAYACTAPGGHLAMRAELPVLPRPWEPDPDPITVHLPVCDAHAAKQGLHGLWSFAGLTHGLVESPW